MEHSPGKRSSYLPLINSALSKTQENKHSKIDDYEQVSKERNSASIQGLPLLEMRQVWGSLHTQIHWNARSWSTFENLLSEQSLSTCYVHTSEGFSDCRGGACMCLRSGLNLRDSKMKHFQPRMWNSRWLTSRRTVHPDSVGRTFLFPILSPLLASLASLNFVINVLIIWEVTFKI